MATLHERVTPAELARAWEALQAGQFRDAFGAARRAPQRGVGSAPGAAWWLQRAVVAVVGGHGWSGASTTALLLAHTYAAAGCSVRLVDGASPARSGLVAAARTEHGLDATRRWRVGSRGAVQVLRPAEQLAAAADLPDWDAGHQDEAAVTVAEIVGIDDEFQLAGHGLEPLQFAQADFVPDGGDDRFGLAPRLNEGHQFGHEVLGEGYGCACHE